MVEDLGLAEIETFKDGALTGDSTFAVLNSETMELVEKLPKIVDTQFGYASFVGKNHMLITPKYSSYVFLAELVTDAVVDCQAHEIAYCLNCGACMRACPSYDSDEECLSALTQKKGTLSSSERLRLLSHPLLWGCDICQEVCPHTKKALESGSIYSPVPFFSEEPIPRLGSEILASMSDEEFSTRAYAWRKRETIQRNVHIKEKGDVTCSD